jgi:hypothetical protein
MHAHPMCRPPKDAVNVERWNGRRWIPDDGKPGRCFSGEDSRGFPIAWAVDCDCSFIDNHMAPIGRAMRRTAERFGCANGRDRPPIRRGT